MTSHTATRPHGYEGEARKRVHASRTARALRGDRRARRAGMSRALLASLAATGLAATLIGISALPTMAERAHAPVTSTTTILVQPSQTLWTIAVAHPVAGATTVQTVAMLRQLNELAGSEIPAGSVLVVPSSEDADAHLAGELPQAP